jgi:hypothetical protein
MALTHSAEGQTDYTLLAIVWRKDEYLIIWAFLRAKAGLFG